MNGSLTLSELDGACTHLEIRCARCGRHGRLRLSRLIDRYGKDARLPDVRHRLSADCPHHDGTIYERCDVYFPELASMAGKQGRLDRRLANGEPVDEEEPLPEHVVERRQCGGGGEEATSCVE